MGKAKKHSPEQIVNILRQNEVASANGKTHPLACREAGITEQTFYRWRKENGGMKTDTTSRALLIVPLRICAYTCVKWLLSTEIFSIIAAPSFQLFPKNEPRTSSL
jgi:hypothetical protein